MLVKMYRGRTAGIVTPSGRMRSVSHDDGRITLEMLLLLILGLILAVRLTVMATSGSWIARGVLIALALWMGVAFAVRWMPDAEVATATTSYGVAARAAYQTAQRCALAHGMTRDLVTSEVSARAAMRTDVSVTSFNDYSSGDSLRSRSEWAFSDGSMLSLSFEAPEADAEPLLTGIDVR